MVATHLREDASLQHWERWLLAEGDPDECSKMREDAWITSHGGSEDRFAAAAHAARRDPRAALLRLVGHLGQSGDNVFKELHTRKVRVRQLRHLPRDSRPLQRLLGRWPPRTLADRRAAARVADVSMLGDRAMLAVRKGEGGGLATTQPLLLGRQRGQVRMLHGGSNVVYCCLENVARGAKLELSRYNLGKRACEHIGAVFQIDATLRE